MITSTYILELKVAQLSQFRDGVVSHFRRDVQLHERHLFRACGDESRAFFTLGKVY